MWLDTLKISMELIITNKYALSMEKKIHSFLRITLTNSTTRFLGESSWSYSKALIIAVDRMKSSRSALILSKKASEGNEKVVFLKTSGFISSLNWNKWTKSSCLKKIKQLAQQRLARVQNPHTIAREISQTFTYIQNTLADPLKKKANLYRKWKKKTTARQDPKFKSS